MTRLNLVPPSELMDQHLFAEFREIKMVPKSLARSILAARKRLPENDFYYRFWQTIPKQYSLNKGHVSFFYDKGEYLLKRYVDLMEELDNRGVQYNRLAKLDPNGVFDKLDHNFHNSYTPTPDALAIIRERIEERLALRPGWYRYYGEIKE